MMKQDGKIFSHACENTFFLFYLFGRYNVTIHTCTLEASWSIRTFYTAWFYPLWWSHRLRRVNQDILFYLDTYIAVPTMGTRTDRLYCIQHADYTMANLLQYSKYAYTKDQSHLTWTNIILRFLFFFIIIDFLFPVCYIQFLNIFNNI